MNTKTKNAIKSVFSILGVDRIVSAEDAETYHKLVTRLIDKGITPTTEKVADKWPKDAIEDVMAEFAGTQEEEDEAGIEEFTEKVEVMKEQIAEALGVSPDSIQPHIYRQSSPEEIQQSTISQISVVKRSIHNIMQEAVNVGAGLNSEKSPLISCKFKELIGILEDTLADIAFDVEENLAQEYDIIQYKQAWEPYIKTWRENNPDMCEDNE